jgi:hypothetical protein
MAYTLSYLTTADDCDAVLTDTQHQLRLLNHQVEDLAIDEVNSSRGVVNIEVELAKADSEIDTLNTLIPTLTDASNKKNSQMKLRRAENRKSELQYRRESSGGIAALMREVGLKRVQLQITELTSFAAAVTAHKATL